MIIKGRSHVVKINKGVDKGSDDNVSEWFMLVVSILLR